MIPKPFLSIITTTYQSEKYVKGLIEEIYRDIVNKFPEKTEVIVYDGGSQDKTQVILKKIHKKYHFRLEISPKRDYYTSSVKKLYQMASGKFIFYLDSDGECPPKEFWKLYQKFQETKADIINGTRSHRRPLYRLLISRANYLLVNLLFGLKTVDSNCGFKLTRKKVIGKIISNWGKLRYNPNTEYLILTHKAGLKINQATILHHQRESIVSPTNKILKQIFMGTSELIKFRFGIIR
jgi:glycosyltransferase involved in cell wall biosynthesis